MIPAIAAQTERAPATPTGLGPFWIAPHENRLRHVRRRPRERRGPSLTPDLEIRGVWRRAARLARAFQQMCSRPHLLPATALPAECSRDVLQYHTSGNKPDPSEFFAGTVELACRAASAPPELRIWTIFNAYPQQHY